MSSSFRQPACALCGHRSTRPRWTLRFDAYPGPFRLWTCAGCGVVFNWPRLSPDALNDQYDADYYIFTLPPARRWARAAQLYLQYLYPLESQTGRRLLEVGCAAGDLLAIAARRGWNVQGIEISPEPARRARLEHGVPVETGTLEEKGPGLGRFDVAIATDVIEHVPAPGEFLSAMRNVLRPGGQAIIETPNLGGFWGKVGGARWIGLNRFHIFLFTPASLIRLMRAAGFDACRSASSTHAAHCCWGDRPELAPLIRTLPAVLRWRAQRGLNRVTPTSLPVSLWREPPRSLDEALARIADAPRDTQPVRPSTGLAGDNLCVIGRAGPGGRHAA